MEDERGLYYFARTGNADIRVYTRMGAAGEIEFRLWHRDYPEIWEEHGWASMGAILAAAELHKEERGAAPEAVAIYDESIARSLLKGKK